MWTVTNNAGDEEVTFFTTQKGAIRFAQKLATHYNFWAFRVEEDDGVWMQSFAGEQWARVVYKSSSQAFADWQANRSSSQVTMIVSTQPPHMQRRPPRLPTTTSHRCRRHSTTPTTATTHHHRHHS